MTGKRSDFIVSYEVISVDTDNTMLKTTMECECNFCHSYLKIVHVSEP